MPLVLAPARRSSSSVVSCKHCWWFSSGRCAGSPSSARPLPPRTAVSAATPRACPASRGSRPNRIPLRRSHRRSTTRTRLPTAERCSYSRRCSMKPNASAPASRASPPNSAERRHQDRPARPRCRGCAVKLYWRLLRHSKTGEIRAKPRHRSGSRSTSASPSCRLQPRSMACSVRFAPRGEPQDS